MKLRFAGLAGSVARRPRRLYATAAAARRARGQISVPQGPRRLRRRPHRRGPRDLPEGSRRGAGRAQAQPPRQHRIDAPERDRALQQRRPKDKADCLARIEGPSRAEPDDDHLGQRRRRRHPARDHDHDDRHADRRSWSRPRRRRARRAERADAAARPPSEAISQPRRRQRSGAAILASLLVAPWLPFTSPTSSRPSTGGAIAVPSPDGITACAEVLALAEVYALMVYYHESECDEASMPPAAQRGLARLVRIDARCALHRYLLDQPGR